MTSDSLPPQSSPRWPLLARKDVLAGFMFVGIAALGLFLSRNYPIGTALRMGTGYVPRLLCWILLALGAVVLLRGLRAGEALGGPPLRWRPFLLVPASLLAFALTIHELGLIVATLLLIGIGSLAGRDLRPLEVVIAALVLVTMTYGIFVWGLGLPIQVWPDW
jgi:putative tricarboxylic transport membrane protein